jgi:adenosine deaminase
VSGGPPSGGVTVDFVRSLPKAEVHVHLEGAPDADTIEELARAAGRDLPAPTDRLFEFTGLGPFLEFLDWWCGLVRTPQQLARLAYGFARTEADWGVRYADLTVSPIHWAAWRGRLEAFIDTLGQGLAEAEQDGLPSVGLCVSMSRTMSSAQALEFVDRVLSQRHPRVVAITVDGNEAAVGRTGHVFAPAFRRAREAGLRVSAHAGESSGPEGVRDAVEILGAERIEHGVRAIEDPDVVRLLADRRIPLGVCPWSNVLLGLYPTREDHPIDALRRAGVPVSVNTDDPALFGCRLDEEYLETARTHGWDRDVVRAVARTSLEASFCDEDTRRALLAELDLPGEP